MQRLLGSSALFKPGLKPGVTEMRPFETKPPGNTFRQGDSDERGHAESLRVARFPRMLIAFYVLGIVLIDVVTGGATPSVDGYDLRLSFA